MFITKKRFEQELDKARGEVTQAFYRDRELDELRNRINEIEKRLYMITEETNRHFYSNPVKPVEETICK